MNDVTHARKTHHFFYAYEDRRLYPYISTLYRHDRNLSQHTPVPAVVLRPGDVVIIEGLGSPNQFRNAPPTVDKANTTHHLKTVEDKVEWDDDKGLWKFQVTLYVAPTAEVARLFTQKRPEPVTGELALRPWQEPVRFQVRIEAPDDEAFR